MAFGTITKTEFINFFAGRTLDQWYAELRFRKSCGELARKLKPKKRKPGEDQDGE